jgi:hypothetical protein
MYLRTKDHHNTLSNISLGAANAQPLMEQFVTELWSAGHALLDLLELCNVINATIMAATAAISAATICALALVIRRPSLSAVRMNLFLTACSDQRAAATVAALPPVRHPQPHWPGSNMLAPCRAISLTYPALRAVRWQCFDPDRSPGATIPSSVLFSLPALTWAKEAPAEHGRCEANPDHLAPGIGMAPRANPGTRFIFSTWWAVLDLNQ